MLNYHTFIYDKVIAPECQSINADLVKFLFVFDFVKYIPGII